MKQKGFASVFILPVVVFVAIFAYLVYKSLNGGTMSIKPTPTPLTTDTGSPEPTVSNLTDWKTYTNEEFNFSMQHPKEFSVENITGKEATPSAPAVLTKIAFTDSNKNQFTLNIYPESTNPDVNTKVENLAENSGYCGAADASRTLISKTYNENGLSYKHVAQVDRNGRNIADYCFFGPKGNLFTLRNNTGSTVVGMKRILTSFVFKTQ